MKFKLVNSHDETGDAIYFWIDDDQVTFFQILGRYLGFDNYFDYITYLLSETLDDKMIECFEMVNAIEDKEALLSDRFEDLSWIYEDEDLQDEDIPF